jgi:LysM repeat protein
MQEKVEELTQQNTELAQTLKSMEEKIQHLEKIPEKEPTPPAKAVSEAPRPGKKNNTSSKPSKVSKIIYRVKDGDNVFRLSERFGVPVEQIRNWNGIGRTDPILPGQVLTINATMTTNDLPSAAQNGGRGKVDRISRQEVPGEATMAGEPVGETLHVIEQDENLSSIAAKHGTSWVILARHNDLPSPNSIYEGQKLRIPVFAAPREEDVPAGENTYSVKSGDTLRSIGRAYGVSWRRLARENGVNDPDNIRIGRLLTIPVDRPMPTIPSAAAR